MLVFLLSSYKISLYVQVFCQIYVLQVISVCGLFIVLLVSFNEQMFLILMKFFSSFPICCPWATPVLGFITTGQENLSSGSHWLRQNSLALGQGCVLLSVAMFSINCPLPLFQGIVTFFSLLRQQYFFFRLKFIINKIDRAIAL